MSTIYKYYLNGTEYQPSNTGGFTLDINLVQESGSYQYVKELNGSINFNSAAYDYILLNSECQKITLEIKEFCGEGTFVIWYGYFTIRDCKFMPDKKQVEVSPSQDSFYKCLTDNYDRKFNALEATNIVTTDYSLDYGLYEYKVLTKEETPFFPPYVTCGGISPFFLFGIFVRELKTTYCQGGEPQPPAGGNWEILFNKCESRNLVTWYRKPPQFEDGITASCLINFVDTVCVGVGCSPAPPVAAGNWYLMDVFTASIAINTIGFWIDLDTIPKTVEILDNGRPLVDVINLGLNKFCPELDLQSNFLTQTINPVTGINPSSTEGIQLHSISDVKDPAATEPATVENITLKELLDSYINSKLNCFWRVDEGTKRLIIEHYNDLNNQGVMDLTAIQNGKFTNLKNQYEYDNSDIPKAEEFPSLDSSIDYTGVDIVYENDCAEGVKSYNTSKFYSELESIIQDPDEYPQDGAVMVTPFSSEPDAPRAQDGTITGDYSPNMPQAMANLQARFWKFYRPFPEGEMNFVGTPFSKLKPIRKLQEIQIPLCCFFFFAPYSRFIGNNFTEGQLQSASFNPATGFITLNIMY